MDIQEKQARWALEKPLFEAEFIHSHLLQFFNFNENTGDYEIKSECLNNTDDEDRKVAYEALNTGWVMWLRAKRNAKAQAVPEWISVEDSFPKKNTKVLLNVVARRRGKPLVCVGFYSIEPDDDPCFVLDENFTVLKGVTHWMMLPQPPKAQEPAND